MILKANDVIMSELPDEIYYKYLVTFSNINILVFSKILNYNYWTIQ